MGGGGVEYFESEFQNRKSSDFQQYDPRPLFKIKYDPHTLSQTKSMTPPPPPVWRAIPFFNNEFMISVIILWYLKLYFRYH